MSKPRDLSHETQDHQSGAPEAGGATSSGSTFGGRNLFASFLRAIARVARNVEAEAYRRLRDLDRSATEPGGTRGRPNRVHEAGQKPHPV